uniref:C2H2-type domain-containing protein n=1 Tax=Neogobius melanostomus TaxID=47308 RepID=A0A8C6TH20_9GOBI
MATRLSIHSQLSSIMETMAKTALNQVCKLVDEDTAELRLECSRLLFANSALSEKVNNLQCELTIVKTKSCKSHRTVGVQTDCSSKKGEDRYDNSQPTIERIFGKDWCKDLWKDRDPSALGKVAVSTGASDESPINEERQFKKEDYAEASTSSQIDALEAKVADEDEDVAAETNQLSENIVVTEGSAHHTVDKENRFSSLEDAPMQSEESKDTVDDFSTYTIPIDDDDEEEEEEEEYDEDDDDVQFVDVSQQGTSQNIQQSLSTNSDNINDLDEYSLDTFDDFDIVCTAMDSNQGSYTCHICNRSFFHKGTLTHHMKSHKSNFCNICKQEFPDGQLDTHICVPPVASHKVSKSCELCGKVFANPSALRIHYVVHTGEKPYRCRICGKGFTQKGNLKCHLRIHTGERPFQCMWCGKTFTQKVNLNHHLMSHRNSVQEGSHDKLLIKNMSMTE